MRISTLLKLGALGAALYYAYRLGERSALESASLAESEPVIMWFETLDERTALCEGAD